MMAKYNEIRIDLDLISVNEIAYVIMYDYFTGDIIGLWKFNGVEDPLLKETLAKYIENNDNISTIFSVRGYVSKFVPIIKSLISKKTKVYAFLKF
jgi:type IV secretory pathway protease TraF